MSIKDYLFYKASQNKIPLSGTFELSPVCNFSCKMCYVRKSRKQIAREGKKEHTVQEWVELAKRCKEAGMLYLLLTGGEPFIYPEFRSLYEQIHEMGIVISINSNGTMIDAETVEWLKDHAPARINITMYGASSETYGRICNHPEGYERVVNAIRMLKEAGISVVINASIIPENAEDLQKIIEFGKENDIVVRAATYMFPPIRRDIEKTDSRLSPQESGRLNVMKQYYAMSKEQFIEQGRSCLASAKHISEKNEESWGNIGGEQMQCRAGRSTFWIDWEGKMNPCGIMDFPVVKYPFEENFTDCWKDLTNQVRNCTVLKECQGCEKRELCHPCAAIIYTETGDVNEKAPYLCEMSDAIVETWEKMLVFLEEENKSEE